MDSHAFDAISTEAVRAGEFGQNPLRFVLLVTCYRYNTARVIASRLQNLQTLYTDWTSLRSVAKVSNDAAAFIRLLTTCKHLLIQSKTTKEHHHRLGYACLYTDLHNWPKLSIKAEVWLLRERRQELDFFCEHFLSS